MTIHSMLFLPYTPRDDADARGYDDWLRSVDAPFFNSVPGIAHYSNWKVAEVLTGTVPFTHFDFLLLEGPSAQVWANTRLQDFAAGWLAKWGRDPSNADLSVNYHTYMADRWLGQAPSRAGTLLLGLDPDVQAVPANAEVWRIREAVVGTPVCASFGFRYVTAGGARAEPWAVHMAVGTLIASK
jgi:hypothetical protein